MLKVGITGGIGSGKSTVASIFSLLGVPVYHADEAAKRLMKSDQHLRNEIIKAFGKESYQGTEINRSFLISHVFNDEDKRKMLNALVHPATLADAANWMQLQAYPYVLKEAAILFETGVNKTLDYVIGVSAPEMLRITRTMRRDHRTEEEVRQMMAGQMNEEEKMKRCDFLIFNDEKQMLIPQVLELHQKLLNLSGNNS